MTIRNKCQEYNLNLVNRSWKYRLYSTLSTKNDPQVLIENLWSDLRSRGKESSTEVRLTSATESRSKTFNANNKIVKE